MSASQGLKFVARIAGLLLALNITPAYGGPVKKRPQRARPAAARPQVVNYYSVARAPAPSPAPAPSLSVLAAPVDDVTKRILNFRVHPIYLMQVLAQKDTIVAVRADLDFVLGEKFTLGPSVIYQQTSVQDAAALTAGTGQSVDTNRLDVGLLANIYLTGTTSTGGFLLRPHVYWVDVNGQKDRGDQAAVAPSGTVSGIRAGSEFVFQKILPCGFNFEVGGGFTYHLVPYSVDYNDGGLAHDTPDNRFQPTVTLAIGWAF